MTRPGNAIAATAVCLLAISACTPEAGPDERKAPVDPVVVYAAYKDKSYVSTLLQGYTRDSGVIVIVRNGDAEAIVDDVMANEISPPADVLWTPSVGGVWRAADEGALRPLGSSAINDNVAEWLRDPEGFWAAVSFQTAIIAYDPTAFSATELTDYAALGDPRFRGRLCLSSSTIAINQTVIAMLIDSLGVKATETAVRNWMTNLAMPFYADEARLLDALESKTCGIGIVSGAAVAAERAGGSASGFAVHAPAATYANAEAVGVTRHARNPAGGVALIEWLTAKAAQQHHSENIDALPANPAATHAALLDGLGREQAGAQNISVAVWHRNEAIKLAERRQYR